MVKYGIKLPRGIVRILCCFWPGRRAKRRGGGAILSLLEKNDILNLISGAISRDPVIYLYPLNIYVSLKKNEHLEHRLTGLI